MSRIPNLWWRGAQKDWAINFGMFLKSAAAVEIPEMARHPHAHISKFQIPQQLVNRYPGQRPARSIREAAGLTLAACVCSADNCAQGAAFDPALHCVVTDKSLRGDAGAIQRRVCCQFK